jgi:hypothetical protein
VWQLDATNRSKVSGVLVAVCGSVIDIPAMLTRTVTAVGLVREV